MMQFPEIGLLRDFLEKLKARVWEADAKSSEVIELDKSSKWDDAGDKTSNWAKRWRLIIRSVLPRGADEALPPTHRDVRKLSEALWKDTVEWSQGPGNAERQLSLFSSEASARMDAVAAASALPSAGGAASAWDFVPAADLLLILGEGTVGITAEGYFADNDEGHKRQRFEDALRDPQADKRPEKNLDAEDDVKKKDPSIQEQQAEQFKNFDWESAWRNKTAMRRNQGSTRRSPSRGNNRRLRSLTSSESSASRRRREKRRRDRSRDRKRSPSRKRGR